MSNKQLKKTILNFLENREGVSVSDLVKATRFSRQYVHEHLKELREGGQIALVGKTSRAKYVIADKRVVSKARRRIRDIHRELRNENLSEDIVLDEIKRDTGIFLGLPENVKKIVDYAFTEMLNNAIEHSRSGTIELFVKNDGTSFRFEIVDRGIGIFNNIRNKRGLKSDLEAIQDLLKGKQTTAPEQHTGEGIFFTSKVADTLVISSSKKKLTFANLLADLFIVDTKYRRGTKVTFAISAKSKRELKTVFDEYASDSYEFDRTAVSVSLYKMSLMYISRSQARRIMSGLDKFRRVVLDFEHVSEVGQAFADEVFRVWKNSHPTIDIVVQNANENILFMIERASQGHTGEANQKKLFTGHS